MAFIWFWPHSVSVRQNRKKSPYAAAKTLVNGDRWIFLSPVANGRRNSTPHIIYIAGLITLLNGVICEKTVIATVRQNRGKAHVDLQKGCLSSTYILQIRNCFDGNDPTQAAFLPLCQV